MKPALATISLFFFLFIFSTKSSPVRAATPEAVVDISGEKVKAGVSYYVLSAYRGRGGGLTFNTFKNDTCPHVVVQEIFGFSKGKPVQFFPLNPKNHVVHTFRNLNIKFSEPIVSICTESGVWRLNKFMSEALNVATNGVEGTQETYNRFMIEKAEVEGAYKLKFCPWSESEECHNDLGIFSAGDGKNYVGLTNPGQFQPLRVVFEKANVDNAFNDANEAVMSI
ncbi:hypothetical protein K1719_002266 [Acacia pycnantha]|nr:hypothetical protein K1719_002266 [Acacia pycnantha]